MVSEVNTVSFIFDLRWTKLLFATFFVCSLLFHVMKGHNRISVRRVRRVRNEIAVKRKKNKKVLFVSLLLFLFSPVSDSCVENPRETRCCLTSFFGNNSLVIPTAFSFLWLRHRIKSIEISVRIRITERVFAYPSFWIKKKILSEKSDAVSQRFWWWVKNILTHQATKWMKQHQLLI